MQGYTETGSRRPEAVVRDQQRALLRQYTYPSAKADPIFTARPSNAREVTPLLSSSLRAAHKVGQGLPQPDECGVGREGGVPCHAHVDRRQR